MGNEKLKSFPGDKVELILNPIEPVPPLKYPSWGDSYVLRVEDSKGEVSFKVIISTEFIGLELEWYIEDLEKLIADRETDQDTILLAKEYLQALQNLAKPEEIDRTVESLKRGRIKHEYRHLDQFQTVFIDNEGSHLDVDKMDRLQQEYRRADKEGVLDKDILDYLDHATEHLLTICELEAMVAEFDEDSEKTKTVNQKMVLWRLVAVLTYLKNHQSLICAERTYLKASLITLTGRLDLADIDTYSQQEFEEIKALYIPSLKLALENPQAFVDQLREGLESQIRPALKEAFKIYLDANIKFMQDVIEKKLQITGA